MKNSLLNLGKVLTEEALSKTTGGTDRPIAVPVYRPAPRPLDLNW